MLKMKVDISLTNIPTTIAIIHWTLLVGGERNVPLLNPMSDQPLRGHLIKIQNQQVRNSKLSQILSIQKKRLCEYGFAIGRLLCLFTNPSFLDVLFTGDKRTNSPVLLVESLHLLLQVFLNQEISSCLIFLASAKMLSKIASTFN